MPDQLIELYKATQKNIENHTMRIWETIKFFTTVFISLITIAITLLTSLYSYLGLYVACFSFFPVIAFITTRIGMSNFERECARLFEQISINVKLEEKLGFHKKRVKKDIKSLVLDEYYLLDRNIKLQDESTDDFVYRMMNEPPSNKYGRVNFIFLPLFNCYKIISFILVGLIFICSIIHVKNYMDFFQFLIVFIAITIVYYIFRGYCLTYLTIDQ